MVKKIEESSSSKSISESQEEFFRKDTMLDISYNLIYKKCHVLCTSEPKSEIESQKYGAYVFSLNNIKVQFRVAKTTPTKVGQFVTFWKRKCNGPIMPYDLNDPFDVYVVCVKEDINVGQFVFSKQVMAAQGILSKSGKGGKRAFRVYAPWVKTENSQAANAKMWQSKFFINLTDSKKVRLDIARKLYSFPI